VAQDFCDLDRMVDLHAGVDGWAAVLFEVLAGFLTGSKKDGDIIYKG
jgi:hypothetical protein